MRSVEQAGAIPLVLAPVRPEDAPALLDRLDGVLLSGGVDVDPALYGQAPHPKLGRVNRRRDDFELALTREALRRDVADPRHLSGPSGVKRCHRGNTGPGHPVHRRGSDGARGVGAALGTAPPGRRWPRPPLLRAILGQGAVSVNSIHHQAVERTGDGLVVSARCPEDGVVEGLEMPGRRFVVGVQWHPESFWNQPESFQPLFDAHVEACRAAALARPGTRSWARAGARS